MIALLLASTLSLTPGAQANETEPKAGTAPSAEKKICRREASTTSRMTKRICKTQADWAAQGELIRDKLPVQK